MSRGKGLADFMTGEIMKPRGSWQPLDTEELLAYWARILPAYVNRFDLVHEDYMAIAPELVAVEIELERTRKVSRTDWDRFLAGHVFCDLCDRPRRFGTAELLGVHMAERHPDGGG